MTHPVGDSGRTRKPSSPPSNRTTHAVVKGRPGWSWGALAVLLLIGTLSLDAEVPGTLAIRDARVVPVSGPVIDKGTVVIAKGRIAAVGASVAIPPEAWVIDGQGLTVYPGLIDALTDLGLATPALASAPASQSGTAPRTPATPPAEPRTTVSGPQDRPASTPWVQAADELRIDERRFESWRASGFTTALTAPKTGILQGQGAVINLAGERPGDLVVRAPSTLHISLQLPADSRSFPGSNMGVVAYVRQVFNDAEHDRTVRQAYDASLAGSGSPRVDRPAYDRTLRALNQARDANLPVVVPAGTPTQMARAIDLARELKLQPILFGVHHGYRVPEQLAVAKVPAIVSLKWPERDANGDPDAEETLQSLRLRANAPSTPAALHKHGVPFAFSSDGVQPRDLLKQVRAAIDAGLAPEAALRALTLGAAEILGVADRLGSLQPGRMANLIVTDGDLFAEKTRVKMVFVDGEKLDVREDQRQKTDSKAPDTPDTIAGTWTVTTTTPDGPQTGTVTLAVAEGGTLSGTVVSGHGTFNVTRGSVTGNRFTFSFAMPRDGQNMEVTMSGTVDGATMKGTMSTPSFTGEFTGTRPNSGRSS